MDGRSNIPQLKADYPIVTTGKKIDGGKTRGRDLRDEEEGFLQTTRLFCGKCLHRDGLSAMRSELGERRCNKWELSDIQCRNNVDDAMWHIYEVHVA